MIDMKLETDMDAMAQSIVDDALQGIEDAFTKEMVPFAEDVRRKTPRRTGYLAGRFHATIDRMADTFRMSIVNDADYAPFVVIKRWGSKNLAKTLLYDPGEALAQRMAEIIANRLSEDTV